MVDHFIGKGNFKQPFQSGRQNGRNPDGLPGRGQFGALDPDLQKDLHMLKHRFPKEISAWQQTMRSLLWEGASPGEA